MISQYHSGGIGCKPIGLAWGAELGGGGQWVAVVCTDVVELWNVGFTQFPHLHVSECGFEERLNIATRLRLQRAANSNFRNAPRVSE